MRLGFRDEVVLIRDSFEADESDAFNHTRQIEAEKTLERLLAYMSTNHLGSTSCQYVADFDLPWNTRLPASP